MPRKLLATGYWLRPNRGFTLIELLIVIVVIGVLAAVGINTFGGAQERARDVKRKTDLDTVRKALYNYKSDFGSFCFGGPSGPNCPTWTASFADGMWGADGQACPTLSLRCSLKDKGYITTLPRDVKFTTVSDDYYLYGTIDTFVLSAKLEKPGTQPLPCTPQAGRNYCITE